MTRMTRTIKKKVRKVFEEKVLFGEKAFNFFLTRQQTKTFIDCKTKINNKFKHSGISKASFYRWRKEYEVSGDRLMKTKIRKKNILIDIPEDQRKLEIYKEEVFDLISQEYDNSEKKGYKAVFARIQEGPYRIAKELVRQYCIISAQETKVAGVTENAM